MILLVVTRSDDMEEVLEAVEFSTLLFFAGLFIMMRAMEELGLIEFIADQTTNIIQSVDQGNGRLSVAILLIIVVSGIVSAFVDNIPYTTTLVPVIVQLSEDANLPLEPLVWALVFGACFGGNGTIIGASANVVAVGLCEQEGYRVSFLDFFKIGFPVMVVSLFVATIFMLIFHVAIPWYS